MFSAFERLVAFRYLRARRQEGFISIIAWFSLLGITLGVATLIIVMAVMNGFREELLTRVLGLNGHINIAATERQLVDFDVLAARVRGTEGVTEVTPIIESQVLASANNIASGAIVRALRASDFAAKPILAENLKAGSIESFARGDGVFLGSRLVRRMALSVGDHVTLISPRGNPSAFGTVPRMKAYRVIGIVEIGMFEYDNNFIYMPLPLAQKFFKLRDGVSSLEVVLEDADQAGALRAKIIEELGGIGYVRGLAAGAFQFLHRASGRAQRHVPHFDADNPYRRLQYRLEPDHAGKRQGQGNSNPPHAGCHEDHDSPHLLYYGRQCRRGRNGRWKRARHRLRAEYRDDTALDRSIL